MNSVYVIENFASAIIYKSFWWGAVSVFYIIFIAIRLYILSAQSWKEREEKRASHESRLCRRVGLFLLLLGVLLALTIAFSTVLLEWHSYSGFLLIGFSIYAVYSVTASAVGIINAKKNKSALNYVARNTTLTAALISLYNLQYSWLLFLKLGDEITKMLNLSVAFVIIIIIFSLCMRLIKGSHGLNDFSYNKSSG